LEANVREYVRSLVLRCSELGRFDFVAEVASRLPVGVFFTMLDIPTADWERLFDIIIRAVSSCATERFVADAEMLLYLSELAAARRNRPGDDLLSIIATTKIDDHSLSIEEVILNFANVISAGIYTTRLATGGGLQVLLEHPQHWSLLRENQQLIPLAVEEIVRWTSPSLALYRTATKDVELGERRIRRDDRVAVWIPSLNRDERAFSSPDSFNVLRTPNRHFGFGVGAHACIGAAFARLELRVLFQELTTTWKEVVSAGEPRRIHSLVLHGIDSLPIDVTLM
jgi:cytochrome P450